MRWIPSLSDIQDNYHRRLYPKYTYIFNELLSLINQPSTSGQIALTYQISVGEDYSGITYLNLASGTTTAYNFIPQLTRRRKIKLSDYDNKFMTNRDKMNIRGGTLTNKIFIPMKSVMENPYPVISAYGYNNAYVFSRQYSQHQNPTGNPFFQYDVGGGNVNNFLNNNPRNLADDIQFYEISFYYWSYISILQESGGNIVKDSIRLMKGVLSNFIFESFCPG